VLLAVAEGLNRTPSTAAADATSADD